MDSNLKEILRLGVTLFILVAIIYGGSTILSKQLGTTNPIMVVISQSMVPTLGVGDFIIIEAIHDYDDIATGEQPVGDILVFTSPRVDDEFIVHRAIDGYKSGDSWVYQTKGDNNPFPDGFQVSEDQVVGRVINRVPIVGYFSLFIKTMRGFGLVLGLMAVSFFYDNLLPERKQRIEKGRFNYLVLVPFIIAPAIILSIWLNPVNHQILESMALMAWYMGCFLFPLSIEDDDTGLMFWLYHLVLLIIPIACDLVWWTTGITPSKWWMIEGSTVPVSWLLLEETVAFQRTFNMIILWLGPGIFVFFGLLYMKRSNILMVERLYKKIRGQESLM